MIDVDMVMASLENAIASTGGFCVGRSYVVGHQRLSGLGYCFSASLPPLLATAASEAIKIIDEQPERVNRVRENATKVHKALEKIFSGTLFALVGAEISPLKHLQWKGKKEQAEEVLDQLVDKLFDNHSILVTRARYLVKEECFPVESSIKVMVQSELTDEEMDRFVNAVSDIVQNL
ncbi:unnamed protein product, partial [Mesorhabditis belari]|uniref:Serine palmitoyltransferase 1 n=1 Tax=Mesorhabditis belari TaxID=2138241 RepID=A0AAF3EXB1_9BILA